MASATAAAPDRGRKRYRAVRVFLKKPPRPYFRDQVQLNDRLASAGAQQPGKPKEIVLADQIYRPSPQIVGKFVGVNRVERNRSPE